MTTRDVIRRAQQIADLENSSFISWNENVSLLNEAMRAFYQDTINNGDKYNVKELERGTVGYVDGIRHAYVLPDDFYQLCDIVDKRSGRPYTRRASTMPQNTKGVYEIVNDTLYICPFGEYVVRYHAKPKTLYYKNETQQIAAMLPDVDLTEKTLFELIAEKKIIADMDNGRIAYVYRTETEIPPNEDVQLTQRNTTLYVYDIKANELLLSVDVTECDTDNAIKSIALMHGNVVLGGDTVYYTNVDGGVVSVVTQQKGTGLKSYDDNELYVLTESGVYNVFGNVHIEFEIEIAETSTAVQIDDKIYFANKDGFFSAIGTKYNFDTFAEVATGTPLAVCDGNVYFCQQEQGKLLTRYYVRGNDPHTFSKVQSVSEYIGFLDASTQEGYGFVEVAKSNPDTLLLHSWCDDDEIEVPNNFYISAIAYRLAMAYKIKQGADISGLSAAYDEALSNYYDSQSNDAWTVQRINNVY